MYYKTTEKIHYRTGPGKSYKSMGVLEKGTLVYVASIKDQWLKIVRGGKYFYCSAKYATKTNAINYGAVVSKGILPLAKIVVKKKPKHVSGAYEYTGSKINCSVFVSKILQNAKLLSRTITLYHTDEGHKKSTLNDVVINRSKVKHYSWYKTNAKYSKLSAKYKRPGCIYIYPSSVGILGADKHIYGCHSTGKRYTSLGMIRHSSGYEYEANILAVGVPKIE